MNLLPSIDATELPVTALDGDDLWYKDAIIYQLHVKAFADSNNDGIGDFAGLTEKLGYLQDLGVTAVWLLPFYPSPGRDDGYDIADYGDINRDFGTMKDFKRFIQEAKKRGLKVITELKNRGVEDIQFPVVDGLKVFDYCTTIFPVICG